MPKNKDYIENIEGAERRFLTTPVSYEMRTAEDEDKSEVHIIEGYAANFNERTSLGWMDEVILNGAFDDVLLDDVRCLINHNPTLILARSVAGKGTLTLTIDEKGLKYSYTTPDRTYAKDLQDAIQSGDVTQSSFSFLVGEVNWLYSDKENEPDLRQIKKFKKLIDVSPVTFPAYQDTTVAKRSFDALQKPENTKIPKFDGFNARQRILNLSKIK